VPDSVLLAFHASRPEGPFLPHPLNPVKEDIRSARPGGMPFEHEGALWRPARDASVPGGGISFNRVHSLTPQHFLEETVRTMGALPGPWSDGIRTISRVGTFTLVDGLR